MGRKIIYTKEMMEEIISSSLSIKECYQKMGVERTNGTRTNFHKLIKKYNLNISHFKNTRNPKFRTNEELFIKNCSANRSTVKKRILKENLLEYKCQICGQNENWQGKKMPLILDHINGINNDHRLKNLRFLCSNCDSIQDNYKSKNQSVSAKKKKIRKELEKQHKKILREESKQLKIKHLKEKILNSDIDFSKKTWGVEVAKIINKTPQYSLKWVKEHMNEYLR